MSRVLVTGATGGVGSQVVADLLARGEPVRALVRDEAAAARRLGPDVELVAGDLADPRTLDAAVDGADRVFLATANHPEQVAHETHLIEAAAAAGVRRLVKLSAQGAEIGSPVAFWDAHGRIEEQLRASGLPATVLRPATYMTNVLAAAGTVRELGRMFLPAEGAKIAMIDPRDVGRVGAAALAGDGYEGESLVLTGPETVTFADVAGHLTRVIGRPVEFVPVPDDAARESLVASGAPEWFAVNLVTLFGLLRQGALAPTTDTVRAVTGRPPGGFAAFARDHADAFRS